MRPSRAHRPRARRPRRRTLQAATPRRVPSTRRRRWPRRPGVTHRAQGSPARAARLLPIAMAAAAARWPLVVAPAQVTNLIVAPAQVTNLIVAPAHVTNLIVAPAQAGAQFDG